MPKSLKNKVAWITGAGTGIGQAAAVALADKGARVVLSGRRIETLEETAASTDAFGVQAMIEVLDVSDAAQVAKTVDRIVSHFGRLDILVNNAGTNVTERHWGKVTMEKWKEVIDVDLNGAFYCISAVLPAMRKQQDGLIINVASWAGRFYTYLTGPAYSSAKHGMLALNESINMEECINGIRACALCPGEVWTPIMDRRPDQLSDDVKAKMLRAEDVAEAIAFLACLPRSVCINEMLISPTWNRTYIANLTPNP
jgi:NADP-dependent 3-hydroxy acid dehydrogenase YdfG